MVTFYLKVLDVDVLVNFECKRFILQVRFCTAFKGYNKLIDKKLYNWIMTSSNTSMFLSPNRTSKIELYYVTKVGSSTLPLIDVIKLVY